MWGGTALQRLMVEAPMWWDPPGKIQAASSIRALITRSRPTIAVVTPEWTTELQSLLQAFFGVPCRGYSSFMKALPDDVGTMVVLHPVETLKMARPPVWLHRWRQHLCVLHPTVNLIDLADLARFVLASLCQRFLNFDPCPAECLLNPDHRAPFMCPWCLKQIRSAVPSSYPYSLEQHFNKLGDWWADVNQPACAWFRSRRMLLLHTRARSASEREQKERSQCASPSPIRMVQRPDGPRPRTAPIRTPILKKRALAVSKTRDRSITPSTASGTERSTPAFAPRSPPRTAKSPRPIEESTEDDANLSNPIMPQTEVWAEVALSLLRGTPYSNFLGSSSCRSRSASPTRCLSQAAPSQPSSPTRDFKEPLGETGGESPTARLAVHPAAQMMLNFVEQKRHRLAYCEELADAAGTSWATEITREDRLPRPRPQPNHARFPRRRVEKRHSMVELPLHPSSSSDSRSLTFPTASNKSVDGAPAAVAAKERLAHWRKDIQGRMESHAASWKQDFGKLETSGINTDSVTDKSVTLPAAVPSSESLDLVSQASCEPECTDSNPDVEVSLSDCFAEVEVPESGKLKRSLSLVRPLKAASRQRSASFGDKPHDATQLRKSRFSFLSRMIGNKSDIVREPSLEAEESAPQEGTMQNSRDDSPEDNLVNDCGNILLRDPRNTLWMGWEDESPPESEERVSQNTDFVVWKPNSPSNTMAPSVQRPRLEKKKTPNLIVNTVANMRRFLFTFRKAKDR